MANLLEGHMDRRPLRRAQLAHPQRRQPGFRPVGGRSIWAGLFYGDPSGVIHPGLVKEIPTVSNGEVSSDAKTWTFKLRPGLEWSDGQPITAKDIDYTWKLWTGGKFTTGSVVGFDRIKSTDISTDNLSITFHLSQPFAPFLSLWTDVGTGPMPEHFFGKMAPTRSRSRNTTPTLQLSADPS